MNSSYKDDELLQDDEELISEIKKYDKGFLNKIPYSIKAILLKYWFYGAVCFFSLMGFIGISGENAALVAGLIAGALFDVACYNLLEMMDSDNNKAKYYMMYKSKKIYSVFINVVYQVVVFLAAITSINTNLYEAAEIDGAGHWQKCRYVTIPGIKPMITLMCILNIGNIMNAT